MKASVPFASRIAKADANLQERYNLAANMVDSKLARMQRHIQLELDTAGNVRLEAGSPGTPWHDAAVALVKRCFSSQEAVVAGWAAMEVVRCARVQNRALCEGWGRDAEEPEDVRPFEHVLWGPGNLAEMDSTIENGFGHSDRCALAGLLQQMLSTCQLA